MLIDEPGSYLHARAQRDVLHLFEDHIVAKNQIIYSTHSPYLIPPDKLHRLRIVLKTTESGTKVLDRLTHPDLRGEDFADSLARVITAIGIDISQSIGFNRERNLFVERYQRFTLFGLLGEHLQAGAPRKVQCISRHRRAYLAAARFAFYRVGLQVCRALR